MPAIGLGLVPVTSDPGTLLALHEVAMALGDILGGSIEVHTAASHEALEADFAAGRTQLVWSSPALALSSPRLRSAVPVVASVREGVAYYHSVLVVRKSSPIASPLSLRGACVAWVARTSASGYIFPRVALAGHGIDPTTLFLREDFLGAHGAVVEAVQRGHAHVGATFAVFERGDATRPLIRAGHHETSSGGLSAQATSGTATAAPARGREPLRVLLATPPIPSDLFLASRSLYDDHGPLVTRALEALAARVPRALQTAFGAEGLVPTTERELSELRQQLADAQAMGLFEPPERDA